MFRFVILQQNTKFLFHSPPNGAQNFGKMAKIVSWGPTLANDTILNPTHLPDFPAQFFAFSQNGKKCSYCVLLNVYSNTNCFGTPQVFVSHEHCARWCICRVPVPAGCSSHCSVAFGNFQIMIVSTIPPSQRAVHFVHKPCCLDRVRHADSAFCRVRALSCATPRMRVLFFFIPHIRRSGTRCFLFFGVTKFIQLCHCATCQGLTYTKNEYSLFYQKFYAEYFLIRQFFQKTQYFQRKPQKIVFGGTFDNFLGKEGSFAEN